jgi:hypothetical protein
MTDFSLSLQGTVSPFDSIRRIDEQGKEYWSARELMPLLGYSKWENFKNVIEVAKENLETVVDNAVDHFLSNRIVRSRVQGGESPLYDYSLSRLACYYVALGCDSRGNKQLKLAQGYFAKKCLFADHVIYSLTGSMPDIFSTTASFTKDKSGFVYLIKTVQNDSYKIGCSKNVYKRLEQLQTSCPFELIVIHRIFSTDAFLLESKLHDYFSAYKIRGEWFELTLDMVNSFLTIADDLDSELEKEISILPPKAIQQFFA